MKYGLKQEHKLEHELEHGLEHNLKHDLKHHCSHEDVTFLLFFGNYYGQDGRSGDGGDSALANMAIRAEFFIASQSTNYLSHYQLNSLILYLFHSFS